MEIFKGKKILLGITGSIAAYKSILLLRLLVKAGADVKVIMTRSSRDFVSPLVLSTLSRHNVLSDLSEDDAWANHVMLGRWADLFVIAPLTCHTLSKMDHGGCDNLLMAVFLSATCPVVVCPAMDEDMWLHPTTKRNIAQLKSDGIQIISVGKGELGSGLIGEGRMAEPEEIIEYIKRTLAVENEVWGNKKVLITAGPTYEPIDPVRFIGNHSSGLMGIEIANACYRAGAEVCLILGPSALEPDQGVHVVRVQTAVQMFEKATQQFETSDIGIFAAAVADFRPANIFDQKWKKEAGNEVPPAIELVPNPDILLHCGANKRANQFVVGFALETQNEEANALKKMQTKKADMLILNSLNDDHSGFGVSTNKITIFEKEGGRTDLPLMLKSEASSKILEVIASHFKK